MNPFEEAELELGLEEGELEGTFPAWLVGLLNEQHSEMEEDEERP